jgi:hypothetical protein
MSMQLRAGEPVRRELESTGEQRKATYLPGIRQIIDHARQLDKLTCLIMHVKNLLVKPCLSTSNR